MPRVGASRLAIDPETEEPPTASDAEALTDPVEAAPLSAVTGTDEEVDDEAADRRGVEADSGEESNSDTEVGADAAASAGATKPPLTPTRVREVRRTAVTSNSNSGLPLCSLHDGVRFTTMFASRRDQPPTRHTINPP